MSHSYMMEAEPLHPDSAPMTPLPNQSSPSTSSPIHSTPLPAQVPLHPHPVARVKSTKAHVPSACINCKKAHLACDLSRPCKRCVSVGKDDTCRDVEHKKRGRPKLIDKAVAIDGAWSSTKEGSSNISKSSITATLSKTRVKAKYTKSANYKLPKKSTNDSKVSLENFITPQVDKSVRESHFDLDTNNLSSYPEPERPSSALSYRSHQQSSNQPYQGRPLSIHSEPPLPSDHQDPFYYPSSTSQVKRPAEIYSAPGNAPLATIFLTMDLICARVSDESQALWGYHPHDISHKSLYTIVATEDHGKMRNLLGLIKDAVFSAISPNTPQHLAHFPFLESSSPVFYQNRPGIMSSIAPGSSEYTDVIRVCHADGGSDQFNVRMYVGGGLGTDIQRGTNMEHAYVVCIVARHSPPMLNDHSRSNERLSLDETRTSHYNNNSSSNGHSLSLIESPYPSRQPHPMTPQQQQRPQLPRFPSTDSIGAAESNAKISLPPIYTGVNTSTSSLASPSAQSPSTNSTNNRTSALFSPTASNSSSYTVPLSKPSMNSSSLPSLRTGPLHTARWLYDSDSFGGSGAHSSHGPSGGRLPTMLSDPFRAISAPMGGFGVSKYLNRSDPTPSFSHIKRHQLPLPNPMQGPRSADSINRTPRSLQRDLSSSSIGASFASRSPPSMKRPLADMADSQDRNRDIDNRHQDHYQHQGSRPLLSSSLPTMSRSAQASVSQAPYQQSLKLDLQSMPPDHPSIDPSSSGVCPIVHGVSQRERVQPQTSLTSSSLNSMDMSENHSRSTESERIPCSWASKGGADLWTEYRDEGSRNDQEYENDRDSSDSKGYFDHQHQHHHQGSSPPQRQQSQSPGGHRNYPSDMHNNNNNNNNNINNNCNTINTNNNNNNNNNNLNGSSVNPFSTGPSSPTESYSSHYRSGSSLRRAGSVGRSYLNRASSSSRAPVICMTGACGAVCRCSGEDEETRAVKAMDAARKRMSVHSLLC